MKAKKALKRLIRVEALLSNVLDQYAASDHRVRELLDSAKASVVNAKKTMSLRASPGAARKLPAQPEDRKQRHITPAGRKRLSLATKKRWADYRRKKAEEAMMVRQPAVVKKAAPRKKAAKAVAK
jgi:hypothetical protein